MAERTSVLAPPAAEEHPIHAGGGNAVNHSGNSMCSRAPQLVRMVEAVATSPNMHQHVSLTSCAPKDSSIAAYPLCRASARTCDHNRFPKGDLRGSHCSHVPVVQRSPPLSRLDASCVLDKVLQFSHAPPTRSAGCPARPHLSR